MEPTMASDGSGRMRFAMVCASNNNRSMEAHLVFKNAEMRVSSYGVGGHVKLPGATQKSPNAYDFGTPYTEIHDDLQRQDAALYERNGLLTMLKRNISVKRAPEKWQLEMAQFDVVVTFEEWVFDKVVDDLQGRDSTNGASVLVVNLEVKDNAEEAALAAPQALELCQMLEGSDDWECELDDIMDRFQQKCGRRPLFTICFY